MNAPAQAAPPQTDPYAVFARARAVWAAQRYPAHLSYTVAVAVTERGVDKSKHYHLTYDAQSDIINVNAVSDEELAAPVQARGFTIHLQPRRQGRVLFDKKVGNPGEAVDYLGIPRVAPTYSFGMSKHAREDGRNDEALINDIRSEFNDPMPAVKTQQLEANGKLKAIAVVTSRAQTYTIRLAGIDAIDGHDCYHLAMQPVRNSRDLRLREVWVDMQTFATRRLVNAGNFTGSNVPWLITFDDAYGALYIASETALLPIAVGEHRYEHASISFESISQTTRTDRIGSWFVTSENVMTEPGSDRHR